MVSKEAQVAFNLKKGSLPIRGDVDLAAANDCMKKGLEILAAGHIWCRLATGLVARISSNRTEDLMVEFWKTDMAAGRRAGKQLGRQPRKRQLSLSS
jgi:glucose/mannose transport system substrate-binding protein